MTARIIPMKPGATGAPPRRAIGGIEAALRAIMVAPRQMTTEEMNAALAAMRGEK